MNFSRSDRRLGGTNLSKLDTFYINDSVGKRGGTVGILVGTTFLDHAPVILVLEDQRHPARTQLRILEAVVTDACLCGEIEELWLEAQRQELNPAEQCVKGLRGISLFLHEKAKCRLEELRERKRRLCRGLRALQRI